MDHRGTRAPRWSGAIPRYPARSPRRAPEPCPGSAHIFEPLRQSLDLNCDAIAADHDRAPRHGEIIRQDRDLVILGGIKLDDGAAAQPQHLVHWHIRGAEHHLDIERDFVECRHRILRADVTVGPDHAMVSRWLTCATDWIAGCCPTSSWHQWNGASTRG